MRKREEKDLRPKEGAKGREIEVGESRRRNGE